MEWPTAMLFKRKIQLGTEPALSRYIEVRSIVIKNEIAIAQTHLKIGAESQAQVLWRIQVLP